MRIFGQNRVMKSRVKKAKVGQKNFAEKNHKAINFSQGVSGEGSGFKCSRGRFVAVRLAENLATILTGTLAKPLAYALRQRFVYSRTFIDGKRLRFTASVGACYLQFLLLFALTVVTLFIYLPFTSGALHKFTVKHLTFEDSLMDKPSFMTRPLSDLFVVNAFCFTVKNLSLGILKTRTTALKDMFNISHTVVSSEKLYSLRSASVWGAWAKNLLGVVLRPISLGVYSAIEDYHLYCLRSENTTLSPTTLNPRDIEKAVDFLLSHKYIVISITAIIIVAALVLLAIGAILII